MMHATTHPIPLSTPQATNHSPAWDARQRKTARSTARFRPTFLIRYRPRWLARPPHVPRSKKGTLPMRRMLSLVAVVLFSGAQANAPDPVHPDPESKRPIDAPDTVFLEE